MTRQSMVRYVCNLCGAASSCEDEGHGKIAPKDWAAFDDWVQITVGGKGLHVCPRCVSLIEIAEQG